MNRVIAYIDGFNLYFGLKERGWRRFYWLNVQSLVQNLLKFNQQLKMTKYFTARVIGSPDKQKRQSTLLEALETLPDFRIFYGKYQINQRECPRCRFIDQVPNEKMTDVNMAVEMILDATNDDYDIALLLSADSDLVPPIKAIKQVFPQKRIVVAFPPRRESAELRGAAHACLRIGRANFANSVFPDRIRKADGFILQRPLTWR